MNPILIRCSEYEYSKRKMELNFFVIQKEAILNHYARYAQSNMNRRGTPQLKDNKKQCPLAPIRLFIGKLFGLVQKIRKWSLEDVSGALGTHYDVIRMRAGNH